MPAHTASFIAGFMKGLAVLTKVSALVILTFFAVWSPR